MRIGVFTPLLSQLPLDQVLKKLSHLNIHTVEQLHNAPEEVLLRESGLGLRKVR